MQRLRSSLQKSGISCNQNCLLCYCTFLLITGKCKLDGLSWVSYNLRICWEFPVYLCWFFISFLTLSTFQSESESHSVMPDSLRPHGLCRPWNSPDQNTGVGSCSFILGIFPTQGSNPGLPHCRILDQLSHKGSPGILEWVAYPFSSGSSRPRERTGVCCIAGGLFTKQAIGEAVLTSQM